MISPEIQVDLERLRVAMRSYALESGKTEDEVVAKQGAKLSWNVYGGLRAIAPPRGSIRSGGIERLKAGERGVRVRPSILASVAAKYGATTSIASGKTYLQVKRGRNVSAMSTTIEKGGKRLNLMALAVERELNARESAIGFSGYATPRPNSRNPEPVSGGRTISSRYGFELSDFNLRVGAEAEYKFAIMRWVWPTATEGLSKPKQQAVLQEAISETTTDVLEYVLRKQRENATKHGFN